MSFNIIPKSFRLMSQEIKVVMDDNLVDRTGNFGEAIVDENLILLQTPTRENKITNVQLMHVFYHEKMHFVFHYLGYKKLYADERLVDGVANLLLQSEITALDVEYF